MAATRRGWVHAISLRVDCGPSTSSRRIWGIWVVLPDPVSPTITKRLDCWRRGTRRDLMARMGSSFVGVCGGGVWGLW